MSQWQVVLRRREIVNPEEELVQVVKDMADRLAGKTDRPGLPQLSEEIAGRYDKVGNLASRTPDSLGETDTRSAGMVQDPVPQFGLQNGTGAPERSLPAEGDPAPRRSVGESEKVTAKFEDLEPYDSSRNFMTDVESFLQRWDDAQAGVAEPMVHYVRTESDIGAVTRVNTSEPWPAVVKGDRVVVDDGEPREWTAALDHGVRDMVVAANEKLRCPTVSSCAGHSDPAHGWRLRRLRLLPHDLDEANRTVGVLESSAAAASTDSVSIDLLRGDVLSQASGVRYPMLLVRFTPVSGVADSGYYSALDSMTERFVSGWPG